METQTLMEAKSFSGTLSKNSDKTEVSFSVRVGISGEAFITRDRFPLVASTKFISVHFHNTGTYFERFSLCGAAPDGTKFECDDILFSSLRNEFSEEGQTICPVAHYSLAEVAMPCETAELPVLTWRLKGFQSFASLSDSTDLGTVEMVAVTGSDFKLPHCVLVHYDDG